MVGLKTVTTVIFDLDGTLVDTEPSAARAAEEYFAEIGIRLDPADASFVTGRKWEVALDFLFEKYKPPVDRTRAQEAISHRYRRLLTTELPEVPGAKQFVEKVSQHFRLAVVSGSFRGEIEWALNGLGVRAHFEKIFGAEDYPRSKPAPDGYLLALKDLGADPSQTIVFEDSVAGIESAVQAGLTVVAVSHANHLKQDTSRAHFHIPHFRDLEPEWIHQLLEQLKKK